MWELTIFICLTVWLHLLFIYKAGPRTTCTFGAMWAGFLKENFIQATLEKNSHYWHARNSADKVGGRLRKILDKVPYLEELPKEFCLQETALMESIT